MRAAVLLCALLWSLVDSQPTAPYVSFRGMNLPNHGYVDLSLVGDPETNTSSGDAVQCHTDIQACCSSAEGMRSGTWYFPNGPFVSFASDDIADIHQQRAAQRVDLRRRMNAVSPSGIYRCEIMVDGDDNIRERERVYVGIYGSGGDVTISGGMIFAMSSDDEFTLTCISTGGPATTVTWTRDMEVITEGNMTVFDTDTANTTAEYTHTLTGNTAGEYTCTVTNSISSDSAILTVQDVISMVSVVPSFPASLIISWTVDAGVIVDSYTISYINTDTDCFTDSGTCDDIDGDETMYGLTGLEEGTEYSITVTALLADGDTGEAKGMGTTTPAAPSEPPSNVGATSTSSSITVQWEMVPCIHRNGDITGYSVRYTEVESGSTQAIPVSRADTLTTTIEDVLSSTNYSIEVAAVNDNLIGKYSDPVIVETPQSVFLSLNDVIIPNQGYVVISDIGSTGDNTALLCHTNREATFENDVGIPNSGGNWFALDQTIVNSNDVPGFRRNRGPMVVRLFRETATDPAEGIYHCVIEDDTFTEQTLYVGLYNSGGGSIMSSEVVSLIVDSDLNGASPQFTLTCISTGGPATTVTWTRDSETAVGDTVTTLINAVSAEYTHTLTVTGRLGGLYTCTVANEVSPSGVTNTFTIEVASAPTDVVVMQVNTTSILVSWSPPDPLGDTAGYIISFGNGAGSSNSVIIADSSTDNFLLTGLVMEARYTMSIVATSDHFNSEVVQAEITLLLLPGQPSVSVSSITATSISLSWSDSVVTSYEVMWRETDSGTTEMISGSLTDTSYTIEQLDSTTIYTVTVTATNQAGNTDSLPVIISTGSDSCPDDSRNSETDAAAVIGGVVAIVLILSISLTIIVIVVLVLRSRRGQYTTGPSKREAMPPPGATNTMELSKFSEEPTYVDPDVIHTSSNEAYHTVSQTGGTTTDYETVSDPHTVPPSTSHSSQPPTAGDYEQV